jgi:hypothetical protein
MDDGSATVTAEQKQREHQVQALRDQVLTLKQAVMAKYKGELSKQVRDEIDAKRQAEVSALALPNDLVAVDDLPGEKPARLLTGS